MGFSGGGSNVTKAHTHDSTVVQDGGSLAANVTQFGLTSGSILYSDGSNIQELSVGAAAEVLGVSGSLPAWITNTSNPLIKVTKTYADIVAADLDMDIYTLPQDAALVNIWTDITTVFDVSTAVTIGDAGDENGFTEATDWTSGTGLSDATRGAYVTSFKTMRSTSGTTAIKAYNFTSAGTPPVKDAQATDSEVATGTTITNSGFTVAANSNRILIVSANIFDAAQAVTGITWNGTENFTRAVYVNAGSSDRRSEIWYLVNPTATTADVVTTWDSTGIRRGAGVYSYYDALQVSPIGVTNTANGTGTVSTGTITPTTTNSLIVDSEIGQGGGVIATDTLTAGWTELIDTRTWSSQYNLTPTIGISNDMFYTYSGSRQWTWCAAEIKAVAGASDTQGAVDFYLQVVD